MLLFVSAYFHNKNNLINYPEHLEVFSSSALLSVNDENRRKVNKNCPFFKQMLKKVLLTSFSPVSSTNVRISPQDFLTFSFNPFATLL